MPVGNYGIKSRSMVVHPCNVIPPKVLNSGNGGIGIEIKLARGTGKIPGLPRILHEPARVRLVDTQSGCIKRQTGWPYLSASAMLGNFEP
jgi:hypothetical protein